jgi:hypothetical protein
LHRQKNHDSVPISVEHDDRFMVPFTVHCSDKEGWAMIMNKKIVADSAERRSFIGGSDARIIMGQDEKALIRLWQEKRGEVAPEDLSTNLIGPARPGD